MSKSDPLNLRPNDPIQKWRDEMERMEEERERQRRREEHRERRDALANEAAERRQLEARIAALEQQNRELNEKLAELARTTAQVVDTFTVICEKIDQRNEVEKLKGTMVEKLRAYEAEPKHNRIARERDGEVIDLPNLLAPRRVN
jgi:hypothetical protein